MAKNIIQTIRKNSRRKFSTDEKIRIVIEGLRGEIPITALCRREKGKEVLKGVGTSGLS
jgi:transposase